MEFRSKLKNPDIICFGDSLTVGYQSPTDENPEYQETPYGDYLQHQLGQNQWVVISGLNGELTTGMVNRFRRDVLERSPRFVIILGGTNDLGWNLTPSAIFKNLAMMYDQAQAGSITPIAVTVPSLRPLQFPEFSKTSELRRSNNPEWQMIWSHIERRLELNGRIQEYCDSKKFPCVDLFTATAEADSKLLALSFSNDGLHLSTAGYKLLADLLWNEVFQG